MGCVEDIKFRLNMTQSIERDPARAGELKANRDNIKTALLDSQLYDPKLTTYFILHGFMASWDSDNWMCRLKDLILNKTRSNVFIVDWSGGSQPMMPMDYSASVANTQNAAQMIAMFISTLLKLSPEGSPRDAGRFHLVGHSLGAHISGYVGYSLGKVGRITALDPAGPCFSSSGWQSGEQIEEASDSGFLDQLGTRRLSPQAAKLVVAFHTDTSLFGLSENCAHYDIYVNGGVAQPNCNGLDPAKRITNLLQFKLMDSLDLNIACDHSYAHKLVECAASRRDERLSSQRNRTLDSKSPPTTVASGCYPMAYECRSWEAFKAGECGYCADQSESCIYAGLRLNSLMERVPQVVGQVMSVVETDKSKDDDDDDDDDNINESQDAKSKERNKMTKTMIAKASQGHHFIKSSDDSPTCLYHYQVVIAATHESSSPAGNQVKHYFYLELPLEGSLERSKGKRARNRLVQVSHAVRPQSGAAHEALSERLLGAIVRNFELNRQDGNTELHFYTALITFRSLESSKPCNSSKLSSDSSEGWPLCSALRSLNEARLWSPQADRLEAVQWVAVNYMSGLTSWSRLTYSHLLVPEDGAQVIERDQLNSTQRASMSELSSAASTPSSVSLNPLAIVRSTLFSPIDCLASSLNYGQANSSSTNIKCGRSQRELKYSLRLRPIIKRNSSS